MYVVTSNNDTIQLFDTQDYKNEDNNIPYISTFQPSWNGKQAVVGLSTDGKETSSLYIVDAVDKNVHFTGITTANPSIAGIH